VYSIKLNAYVFLNLQLVFRTDLINTETRKEDDKIESADAAESCLNRMKKVYMTPQNSKKPSRPKETHQPKKTKDYACVFNDITVSY
jgi:hypothetical protein